MSALGRSEVANDGFLEFVDLIHGGQVGHAKCKESNVSFLSLGPVSDAGECLRQSWPTWLM